MILVTGRFTDKHRELIWNESNLCWIDPTKDMSAFDVNEFCNRILDLTFLDLKDEELLIWTNNTELINRLSSVEEIWVVEDDSLTKHKTEELRKSSLSLAEIVTRNWVRN